MGMSIGDGITAAASIFAIVAVIFKLTDRKKTRDAPEVCMAHSGVLSSISNIEGWMKRISADVKELLQKVG